MPLNPNAKQTNKPKRSSQSLIDSPPDRAAPNGVAEGGGQCLAATGTRHPHLLPVGAQPWLQEGTRHLHWLEVAFRRLQ